MDTGTPEQSRERMRRTRQLAEQIVALLNQIGDLGGHPVMGNLIIPDVDIRTNGGKWSVR